jgi:hypothetical protein
MRAVLILSPPVMPKSCLNAYCCIHNEQRVFKEGHKLFQFILLVVLVYDFKEVFSKLYAWRSKRYEVLVLIKVTISLLEYFLNLSYIHITIPYL